MYHVFHWMAKKKRVTATILKLTQSKTTTLIPCPVDRPFKSCPSLTNNNAHITLIPSNFMHQDFTRCNQHPEYVYKTAWRHSDLIHDEGSVCMTSLVKHVYSQYPIGHCQYILTASFQDDCHNVGHVLCFYTAT